MTRRFFSGATVLLAGLLLTAGVATSSRAAEFVKLYNGQDLKGWTVTRGKLEAWKANGEMLSCVAPGGGYLCPEKEYGDFELRLDWRIGKGGNSGVGVRFPKGGWPSTDGFEVQILDDTTPANQRLKPEHQCGSVYTHVGPKAKPSKPTGEWNQYVIRCQGPRVQIWLNEVLIQDISVDDYSNSKGKGKTVLSQRPRKGLLGLQSHGDLVDFRNIEIKEL